ncbi:MAG: tRNA isopentenyl-2-thiomethyl-A-37 hydroxylase MiaE, partial [Cellvibrionales bacterium]|jgi:tRNA-(ms[2]io[6]A)-hydroxylase
VVKLVQSRGLVIGADEKDPYVNAIRALIRQGSDVYLLDRLLTAGVIEARGAERFGLVAEALPDGDLKNFYRSITRSECRHFELFLDLAREYFPADVIESRWQALLDTEGEIIRDLPLRAALH